MQVSETVEISGHLMDTGILSRVLDDIREYEGDWVIDRFDVGHDAADLSHATITVSAEDDESLQRLLMRLQTRGVNQVDPGEATLATVEMDGVFPDGFYSTTNLETKLRVGGKWITVGNPEMDCGLIVDDSGETPRVYTLPMADVRAGMKVVCGASGIKVSVPLAVKTGGSFGFMESDVSSEKPKATIVREIAETMSEAKAAGRSALGGGPGVVHTGAARASSRSYGTLLRRPVRRQRVGDPRHRGLLYGTSLGVDLAQGRGVEHGHERRHPRAERDPQGRLDPRGGR